MTDPRRRALDHRIRPTRAEVDLNALRSNLEATRQAARPAEVLAVVKANAYGHGAVPVARCLEAAGVRFLGVALIEEGLELRNAGVTAPILVMGGAYSGGYELLVQHELTPIVFRLEHLNELARAARGLHRRVSVHVKVDTGMGRLGLMLDELDAFLDEAARHPQIALDGLASHFARADEANAAGAPLTQQPLALFRQCLERMRARGHSPSWRHVSNSAGLIAQADAQGGGELNLDRPGLMLYGVAPTPGLAEQVSLTPVLTWKTGITHLKKLPTGAPVSYGGTWRAPRESAIATLPVGYADGYARSLSNKAQVLVRGRRAPVVGRVCMDMTMVDVTDVPGASMGDEVVLLGAQGRERIGAEELAGLEGTLHYEVLCAVGARVPRVLSGE